MIRDPLWARADALFDAALDLPSDKRRTWLEAVCLDEPELFEQVQELLKLTDEGGAELGATTSTSKLARELAEHLAERWAMVWFRRYE